MNSQSGFGLIYENVGMALDILWEHKMRSGLIILGVAIGVASLMGMVSILLGLQDTLTNEVSSYEQNVLIVQKYDSFLVMGLDESMLHRKNVTEADAEAIKSRCTTVNHVAFIIEPTIAIPPTLHYKSEKSRMVSIIGAQPSLLYIYSLDLTDGRMISDVDVARASKVIVIGHSVRRDLFPNIDPIGKKITVDNNEFMIVGTFAERKSIAGGASDNFAVIPYTTYKNTMWNERDSEYIMASVRENISMETAKDDVIRVMRSQRKLKANQDNNFAVSSLDAAIDLLGRITGPIALILTAISSIALLVGGIGVMNMMLVSVAERTGEIGIRKAVGALRKHILWQFLIEAGTLTGVGGVIGIAAGLSLALVISRLTSLPFSLSPLFILLAVAFSIGVGMFFGLYPAYRAANQSPINAIGYAK
jgi:putative ABC transport system permease protein